MVRDILYLHENVDCPAREVNLKFRGRSVVSPRLSLYKPLHAKHLMAISESKKAFFQFVLEVEALQFGSFTLKSGRVSPYFFNASRFQTARQLARLGEFFAEIVASVSPRTTVVVGPAYKGIPLCIATAMALSTSSGRDIGYLFNRKEAKTHGDEGMFVGRLPSSGDRLVLVDDVITDGETKREAVRQLRSTFDAPIEALVIAFDRMEQGESGRSAAGDFQQATGIPVHSVFTLADLDALLAQQDLPHPPGGEPFPASLRQDIRIYLETYGAPNG